MRLRDGNRFLLQGLFARGQYFIALLFILGITLLLLCTSALAQTERVIRYEYDGAGNIVRAITIQLDAAPQIDQLAPEFISIGSSNLYSATGTNLFNVDVFSNDLDIMITDVQSTTDSATFRVRAGPDANIGNATLVFENAIGQTQQNLIVVEAPPELDSIPTPLVVSSGNEVTEVSLVFSDPRPLDETYSIAITNTSIASTTTTSFTVLAGQDQINVPIMGLRGGATELTVSLEDQFTFYSFPVFVGSTFEQLLIEHEDTRERNLLSPVVGVFVRPNSLSGTNVVLSQPVGVSYLTSSGQFFSQPVSVNYLESSGRFVSPPVGILYSTITNPVFSLRVGAIFGALVSELEAVSANAGSSVSVNVNGFNLNEVTSVSVSSSSGVTVDSFDVNNEGTRLTLMLSVAANAASGQRQLQFNGSNGTVINHTGKPLFFEIQ